MEWYFMLLLLLGGLIVLLLAGIPIAFAFLSVCVVAALYLWGGEAGLRQLTLSIASQLTVFVLIVIVLFMLMSEATFYTGIAPNMIDTVDKWLGHLPGRLGLLAVASGTVLASLTGSSMGSTAILGAQLTPEMERRGYKKAMSIGPILGSGGLAIMIPPSGLAVFLGVIAEVSISRILMAIIFPGLLMAALYAGYIIIRCWIQPSIAPSYEVRGVSLSQKFMATAKYILPLGFIVFMVIGVILLGVATPSEAAGTGALSVFILAIFYKRLNWEVIKKSLMGATRLSILVFTILAGAITFAQILAFSGVGRGLTAFVVGLPVAPIIIFIAMQLFALFLGMFITPMGIIMIVVPLFMPVVRELGFDPVWFSVILLLNTEMATTSPPFGSGLYVMKGVAPPDTTMEDVYRGALPFLACDLIVITMIIAFPSLALWLPDIMR